MWKKEIERIRHLILGEKGEIDRRERGSLEERKALKLTGREREREKE